MLPIAILQHGDEVPPGYLGGVLEDSATPFRVFPLHTGATLPGVEGWSAVVSLGGIMGAYEEEHYPFLHAEKQLIRDAVAAAVPVLGICLGCQVIADALGGRAYKAEHPEVAFATLTHVNAGDPVLCELDGPVVVFHEDTWDPPPGTAVLAHSDRYPQAFRTGSALGIQPHPEATPEMVERWLDTPRGRAEAEAAGADPARFLERLRGARHTGEDLARRLFGAWLEEVRRAGGGAGAGGAST